MRLPLVRSALSCLVPALLWTASLGIDAAIAAPAEYFPVTDALRGELRLLELAGPTAGEPWKSLPASGSLPIRRRDLAAVLDGRPLATGSRAIAATRLRRDLARDAAPGADGPPPRGVMPRAWTLGETDAERVEISLGLEGAASLHSPWRHRAVRWADGSGVHVRAVAQVDRWLAASHLWAGQLEGAEQFTDALAKGTDVALQTEEGYLAYDGGPNWGLMFGRDRWSWGPGDEGSLLLSRTSAPLTGLLLHLRLARLRLEASALHATLEAGSGEQLAAHRLEWQARDGLRLGATELARYRSSGYQPVYLASVIPFSLAQRLLDQDAGIDTTGALRNNVLIGLDAAWRVADGTRLHGELLIDDLHAESATIPNKLGFQLGVEGVGDLHGARLSWGTEYTRLSRFVYTSFYGRSYQAQGAPLGFPTGPDSERLRISIGWAPDATWQCEVTTSRTRRGESTLADAFVPGSPVPDVWSFAGVPESSRQLTGALRWWPASGIDVCAQLGRNWLRDAGHVAGAEEASWELALRARVTR